MHLKPKNNSLALLLLLLTCVTNIWAQAPYNFDRITTRNGLSQSDINTIHQDKKGFMWFGTHDGLNKFDGYDFTTYKPNINNKKSIGSNLIYKIISDKDDNLWIGTTGKGVDFFDKSTGEFHHIKHDKNDPNSLSSDYVNSIFIDNKDNLWVGTANGLNVASLKNKQKPLKFTSYNLVNGKINSSLYMSSIYSIYQDKQNQIWVGSSKGFFMLSRDSMGEIYFKCINEQIGLPYGPVNSIIEDQFGKLLIGSGMGLYVYRSKPTLKKVKQLYSGFISVVVVDKNNNIWAGSNYGLVTYKNNDKNRYPVKDYHYLYNPKNDKSISKNVIKSIHIDKTGIIWIGTQGGGINKIDTSRKGFRVIKNNLDPKSLSYDNVRAFYEDEQQNLWIGTEGGGVNIALKNSNYQSFIKINNFRKCFVITKLKSQNKILFGTESNPGLYELDLSKVKDLTKITKNDIKEVSEITNSVFSILEDSSQNLWIGTYNNGLHRWLKKPDGSGYIKDNLVHNENNSDGLSNNIIRKIYEDSEHNIWFGTADGLSKLPKSQINALNPKFINYKNIPTDKTSISHNYILEITESSNHELWIGTLGGGINKLITPLNQNIAEFTNYSEDDGLANNVIKGILEDSANNMWISTNKGLSRFKPEEGIFKNYDVNDGLQANEFQELAAIKRKNGELVFGGINGFNVFYPKTIIDNPYKAKAVITQFSISNQPVHRGQEFNGRVLFNKMIHETDLLELKHNENSFSFEFAALHYSAPEKNKFAYRLDGFDTKWIYTTSKKRFATYTNLAPGKYTLRIKASNNDGIWEESKEEIKIIITPPFWKTTTAYVLYCLLISLILFLFWKNIIARAEQKHLSELEVIEKNKQDELQNLKLEFFTNISHEFRTPLTLIKGPLDFLQKKGLQIKPETHEEQLKLIQKNTNYLLRLVNQLLDFRKMNQGKTTLVMRNSNIVNFIQEVAEPFQFLVHKKNINFNLHTPEQNIYSWFDHDAIEKIINNLLSNAYKFTPKDGSINVFVLHENDQVIIKVIDSGIGIAQHQMKNIFERYYTKKDKNENNPTGIGIGLAFTKNLVELHQGNIEVISEKGKGTEFIITLPTQKEAYSDNPSIVCKEDTDGDYNTRSSEMESFAIDVSDDVTDQTLSNNRTNELPILLIVDDNEDIRTFIRHSLEDEYKIYEAENGLQGFETAIKIIPNVIITDLVMHIMDGMELCEKLKTTVTTSHIPILILSAKLSQEIELQGLKNGADDYIRKPFDMEVLNLKLKNITKKRALLRKRFNREVNLKPAEVTVTSADERFLKQVIEIIDKHMSNTEFSVEMLVNEIGQSRSNLYLKLKEITGLSSSEFIRSIRLKRAMQLFDSTDLPVKEVMYKTGFSTASYFSKCFKKQFGAKPSDYLNKKKGNSDNISVDDLL
ncbi:signal transduction histidine kinase/ligand-binding sensor domain-containing protein/DNA-binding response OmpR family regulator [Wenyingzhuangia heitensis]|uniref:histidine kinase n=1 Tax=Wenyingzhuangia heitensis TaxID=1487859 RepID=A0ABX0U6R4_9FLAO|nr:two-component regulator propeller domain-containing protein [Wenyingzhuangia heitensis]NIJ44534.1 signal transduction histidine kinase/ligand-binding sensor domain-containing protein/DNA-binding response OmpR family regulator [Wenyingzhuangia heitensis]